MLIHKTSAAASDLIILKVGDALQYLYVLSKRFAVGFSDRMTEQHVDFLSLTLYVVLTEYS